jgi:hypothetical protein
VPRPARSGLRGGRQTLLFFGVIMALFLAFSAMTFYEERDALGRVSSSSIGGDRHPGRFYFAFNQVLLSEGATAARLHPRQPKR